MDTQTNFYNFNFERLEGLLAHSIMESERLHKETELKFRETDMQIKEINESIGGLRNSWGDFLEGLAKPGIIKLFTDLGIEIHNSYPNYVEYRNKQKFYEIDLLLFNDSYIVAVEIKSKLTKKHITKHLAQLKKLQEQPPQIINVRGKQFIDAIAAISIEPEVVKYVIKCGFYVLVQKNNLLEVVNEPNFKPKVWQMD